MLQKVIFLGPDISAIMFMIFLASNKVIFLGSLEAVPVRTFLQMHRFRTFLSIKRGDTLGCNEAELIFLGYLNMSWTDPRMCVC